MEDLSKLIGSEKEKLCAFYRGFIIHHVINMEELIDHYLISYYLRPQIPKHISGISVTDLILSYAEKEQEFLHTILGKEKFNLAFKTDALFFLISKHCKEYIDSNPKFKDTVDKLVKIRNTFAHRKLNDAMCDESKQEIILVYHTTDRAKSKTEKIVMNPKELNIFLVKYAYVMTMLKEVGDVLIKIGKQ